MLIAWELQVISVASSKRVKPSQTWEGSHNEIGSYNHSKLSPLVLKWGKSSINVLPWNLMFLAGFSLQVGNSPCSYDTLQCNGKICNTLVWPVLLFFTIVYYHWNQNSKKCQCFQASFIYEQNRDQKKRVEKDRKGKIKSRKENRKE